MSDKGPLEELLERQKEEAEGEGSFDRNACLAEWLEWLDDLFSDMAGWLEPLRESGHLNFRRFEQPHHEELLGSYKAPSLVIESPTRHKVEIDPGGRIVVGALGRIDFTAGSKKATLVRSKGEEWLFASRRGTKFEYHPLTEETFKEVLAEMLK